ncbi:MAG: winged helix-turn-helix domain-containing protein, partial [Roseiflexaceae bacterium]
VISASDGVTALEYARQRQPDIVVLDVMLPRLDGFSVCRMLRKESAMPIIMLTARQDEVDRIAGLELGADDYLTKPFSVGELLARIRAILRRSDRSASTVERDILHIGVIKLDVGSRRIWRDDTEIQLSQKEFDLLACLMRNRGLALSRDVLLERVWGFDYVGDGRTVDVHIRWLREKVEQDPSNPVYLQTVRGIGYRFDVPNN